MLIEWGQATLERLGYSVVALADSTEALKAFSADPPHFDLVITDQAMPSMAGLQLAKELLKIRPDIPIILCTGHSETVSPEKVKEVGIKQFLMKPLAKQELAEAVRRVLDGKKSA
jgi:CheY-like chemotaxis protein